MKRTIVTMLLLSTLAGFVAAQDRPDGEAQTITGRIVLEEDTLPVLIAGQTRYDLLIHPSLASEISVDSGETVTVEGYVMETASFDLIGTERRIMVTAFESGDTRVVLPLGRRGARGGRWGRRAGGRDSAWYGTGGPMGYGGCRTSEPTGRGEQPRGRDTR